MACDRNAEQRIEDRERRPREQAEFGVGQAEVRLDRLGQDVDDLPVEEIEDIDDQQDPQHRARLRGGAVGGGRPGAHRKSGLFVHSSLPPPRSRAEASLSMPLRRGDNCRLQLPLRRPSLRAMRKFRSLSALVTIATLIPFSFAGAKPPPPPTLTVTDPATPPPTPHPPH